MGKIPEQVFHKNETLLASKHMKGCSASLVIRETENENHRGMPFWQKFKYWWNHPKNKEVEQAESSTPAAVSEGGETTRQKSSNT